jgi:hypothetical protein
MMLIERERSLKDFAGAVISGPPENAEQEPVYSLAQLLLYPVCVQRLQKCPIKAKKPAVAKTAGFSLG